ncbi:hypothetical protein SMICM304S_08493 [Streptomyces microflavus]
MMRVSSRSAASGRSPSSSTRWVSALRSSSCRRSRLSSEPVSIIIVSGRAPGGAYWAWIVREVTSTVMWSMPQRAVTATTADSMARVSAPARNSSRPWRSANRIQADGGGLVHVVRLGEGVPLELRSVQPVQQRRLVVPQPGELLPAAPGAGRATRQRRVCRSGGRPPGRRWTHRLRTRTRPSPG